MAGVPPPAAIRDIIKDLFQNEHYKHDKVEDIITFSLAKLTQEQKDKITYPSGFKPLELYLIYQTDHYQEGSERQTSLSLVTFVRKEDSEYVYALYYDIANQDRYHVEELWDSYHRIILSDNVTFTYSQYLELYNKVKKTTELIGYSANPPYVSLQYSKDDKYYYEELSATGLTIPDLAETDLCGLSVNLQNFVDRLKNLC